MESGFPEDLIQAAQRLIVPLDVPTQAEALALVDRLPQVQFWKVGLELFVGSGPAILDQLKQRQKRIFLDLKFHDIPNTVAGACRSAARYGVDLLTLHATAGPEAMAAGVEAAQAGAAQAQVDPPQILAITVLTSLSPRTLALDLKVPLDLPDYALKMALMAQKSGTQGAVCSPQEAMQLRQVCGPEFVLVCPGVRPAWSQRGDQQRAMTPKSALHSGASFLVMGRPITQAADPAGAFLRVCEEMASNG